MLAQSQTAMMFSGSRRDVPDALKDVMSSDIRTDVPTAVMSSDLRSDFSTAVMSSDPRSDVPEAQNI